MQTNTPNGVISLFQNINSNVKLTYHIESYNNDKVINDINLRGKNALMNLKLLKKFQED